ncbi:TatD family hydrolase [Luedemannella flava]|uniref:TatD family hydrolase n=1 Tax=Luedemannella flava TaxID=349316 RepID=A0ABP4Z2Z8_9ACTN
MNSLSPSEKRQRNDHGRKGGPPPAPDALPAPVLDSHTHLDLVGGDPDHWIAEAAAVNVTRVVQVGCDVPSSRYGVDLANRNRAVLATVALHPNEAPRLGDGLDEALREIEAMAADPRVRGVGETGLDHFRTGDDGRQAQEHSFRAHIAIAKRYSKALVIHDRDAHADILRVIDDEGAPEHVVMHCFSGDAPFALECVKRGFALSFAGTVTFNNAVNLREAAHVTPLDQVLVETDSPFLTPMPYRGRPNNSYLVPLTVRALATAMDADLGELCDAISANGERIFGAW